MEEVYKKAESRAYTIENEYGAESNLIELDDLKSLLNDTKDEGN
jgi:hypothetical protein